MTIEPDNEPTGRPPAGDPDVPAAGPAGATDAADAAGSEVAALGGTDDADGADRTDAGDQADASDTDDQADAVGVDDQADAVGAGDQGEAGDAGNDGPGLGSGEETLDISVPGDLFGPIEAILLIVDEPLSPVTLAQVLGRPRPEIDEALRTLSESYTKEGRGFDLREVAGGWRLYTREEYAEVVERFVLDGQQARLTQAALETLAVVAYRQPVSRARVSAIRGVNCDGVVRTLVTRGLVEEAGSDGESGAILYRTTSYFLERLGLGSLEELPSLAPYLPEVDEMESEHTSDEPAAEASPSVPAELPLSDDARDAEDDAVDDDAVGDDTVGDQPVDPVDPADERTPPVEPS